MPWHMCIPPPRRPDESPVRLEAVATALRDSAELYRIWSRSVAHDEDRDIACEHRRLTELAIARDADGTVEALTAHIQRTTDAMLRYVAGAGTATPTA